MGATWSTWFLEYLLLCVIAAAIFIQKKKPAIAEEPLAQDDAISVCNELQIVENQPEQLIIQVEMLPAETIADESKLVEITDSKVLAHVNNLVPGLAQAGIAVNNASQAAQANGEVLYRAIIPAGAKLADSQAMEGAVRGIYHGADGIRGHANLVAVEAQKGGEMVANTAAAAMGVASMVVGQYHQIHISAS